MNITREELITELVNHLLKGCESGCLISLEDARKEVEERLSKNEYPKSVLKEYGYTGFKNKL